jgi:ankyrin repeat protein
MKTAFDALLLAFETHSVEGIEKVLANGFDLHAPIEDKLPVNYLIEMYFRSDRFADCLRLLLKHGAKLDDDRIAAVLLNDVEELERAVRDDPSLLAHRTSMVCAFSPLIGASLLHVAAEYGHFEVAERLLALGADVDARAATDADGMNGHTPLFHTVNSNGNRSARIMQLLLSAGARVDIRLPGIVWGKGFDWETVCFDVTPVSYAQLGLLPQMHRNERDCYANIESLLRAVGRVVPKFENVPNRYCAD